VGNKQKNEPTIRLAIVQPLSGEKQLLTSKKQYLKVENIFLSFGGLRALNEVNFETHYIARTFQNTDWVSPGLVSAKATMR